MFPRKQTSQTHPLWYGFLLCLFVLCAGVQLANVFSEDSTTVTPNSDSITVSPRSQIAHRTLSPSQSPLWKVGEESKEDEEEPEGVRKTNKRTFLGSDTIPYPRQLTQPSYLPRLLHYALFAHPPPTHS